MSFGVKSAGLSFLSLGEMPAQGFKIPWQSTRTPSFHRHPENYPLQEVAAKDEKTHAHVVGQWGSFRCLSRCDSVLSFASLWIL